MAFGPKPTRRGFLRHGTQAAAALAVPQFLLPSVDAKAADAPSARGTMRFGLTTYQWGKDWDIPTLVANCQKAGVFGVELRTSDSYAHGVELAISAARRAEVKRQFQDSPVTLVGLATSERFDALDPAKVKAAVEAAKQFLQLSHDVGSSGIRVFPNDFHKEVPHEQTIAQIAKAVSAVGKAAEGLGQEVRLEGHGSAGELATLRAIMEQVTSRAVRVKLNSDKRDARGPGFAHQFNLVKDYLGTTLHAHDFRDPAFPNQEQITLLVKMGWAGWVLLEASERVPDRVRALAEQREIWEQMLRKAHQTS